MRNLMLCLVAVFTLAPGAALAAEEGGHASAAAKPHGPEWVQQRVKTCATCHGEGGVSKSPAFPIIAGQYQDYLAHALTAYRDGGRTNPIMAGQAKGLSDAQIEALAAYYAAQPSPLHTPTVHLE